MNERGVKKCENQWKVTSHIYLLQTKVSWEFKNGESLMQANASQNEKRKDEKI